MRLARWFLVFVLAAVVAAPAIGFMHRVVHGPQGAIAQGLAGAHGHGDAAHAEDGCHGCDGHGSSWVASLFAAHADDSSCRLFDQLAQSDALPAAAAAALPLLLPAFLLRRYDGAVRARWAALFDARGPPALR